MNFQIASFLSSRVMVLSLQSKTGRMAVRAFLIAFIVTGVMMGLVLSALRTAIFKPVAARRPRSTSHSSSTDQVALGREGRPGT
jgi:hypothetical protein